MSNLRLRIDAADWLIAMLFAVFTALVTSHFQTAFHEWGDDFAGYLLQARAIDAHALLQEVQTGAHLIDVGDNVVGPPAYPWGYPALLWMTSRFCGWGLNELKIVGVLSNALLAAGAFLLARHYVGRAGSAVASACIVLQPRIVAAADSLGSDLPCLAASAIALLVAHEFVGAPPAPEGRQRSMRTPLILLNAACITVAFSLRSNGAFIAVSAFMLLAWQAWHADLAERRVVEREMALLTLVTTAAIVAYFVLLPDGSLTHVKYIAVQERMMQHRLQDVLNAAAEFIPFSLLRHFGAPTALTSLLAILCGGVLAGMGAWRHRDRAISLVVFFALNIGLIMVFRGKGGARYTFPLLLPTSILAVAAVGDVAQGLWRGRVASMDARARRGVALLSFAAVLALMLAGNAATFRSPPESAISGPLVSVSDSLFAFVRRSIAPDVPVAFFKPRALRWFTGRQGIVITREANLGRAAYVIHDKRADDGRWEKVWQVDRAAIEQFRDKSFVRVYENGQFIVYEARRP